MIGLGLDAGGSATRWVLCDPTGAALGAGEVPPISGHLFGADAIAQLNSAVAALHRALVARPRPTSVIAGVTGLSANTPAANTACEAIAGALGLPPTAVRVREDTWIAYHACFARGEGHMVYAGTGSVGLHVRPDGTQVRVGGRGMLIDDAGSAFWIGRETLNLIWRRRDLDPAWSSPLAAAVDATIGGTDWNSTRAYVYAGGRTGVAMLARAVATADDGDGHEILSRAGEELARLAMALVALAGPKPVALTGRAATLHPLIIGSMRRAAPALSIELQSPDAALAAARLALDPSG